MAKSDERLPEDNVVIELQLGNSYSLRLLRFGETGLQWWLLEDEEEFAAVEEGVVHSIILASLSQNTVIVSEMLHGILRTTEGGIEALQGINEKLRDIEGWIDNLSQK